jgi:hypothetical protein
MASGILTGLLVVIESGATGPLVVDVVDVVDVVEVLAVAEVVDVVDEPPVSPCPGGRAVTPQPRSARERSKDDSRIA